MDIHLLIEKGIAKNSTDVHLLPGVFHETTAEVLPIMKVECVFRSGGCGFPTAGVVCVMFT